MTTLTEHMARFRVIALLVFLSLQPLSPSQELSPNAPADKPVEIKNDEQLRALEKAIEPYVHKARATLPNAKHKYQAGLATGEIFFVTTKLANPDGRFEMVFVKVIKWQGETIEGALASDTPKIHRTLGEIVTVNERDVLDWTISKPDGSEEGNVVGKFLDTYKPH